LELQKLRALGLGVQTRERALGALRGMDRRRLLPAFVHREHETAVLQLLVQVRRRRGREDHHRTFDVVCIGHELAGLGVFAGRGDGQLPFRLQQLQRVARPVHAFLLGDGEDFVLEVHLSHVEQALSGHRRVHDPILGRHPLQHRIHEGGLAGGARALDEQGERTRELA
jgi:hypothetical protein